MVVVVHLYHRRERRGRLSLSHSFFTCTKCYSFQFVAYQSLLVHRRALPLPPSACGVELLEVLLADRVGVHHLVEVALLLALLRVLPLPLLAQLQPTPLLLLAPSDVCQHDLPPVLLLLPVVLRARLPLLRAPVLLVRPLLPHRVDHRLSLRHAHSLVAVAGLLGPHCLCEEVAVESMCELLRLLLLLAPRRLRLALLLSRSERGVDVALLYARCHFVALPVALVVALQLRDALLEVVVLRVLPPLQLLLRLQLAHLRSRPLRLLPLLHRRALLGERVLACELQEGARRFLGLVPSLLLLRLPPPLVRRLLLLSERQVVALRHGIRLRLRDQRCDLLGVRGVERVPRRLSSPLVVGLSHFLLHLCLQRLRVDSDQSRLRLQYALTSVLQPSAASIDLAALALKRVGGWANLEWSGHGCDGWRRRGEAWDESERRGDRWDVRRQQTASMEAMLLANGYRRKCGRACAAVQ